MSDKIYQMTDADHEAREQAGLSHSSADVDRAHTEYLEEKLKNISILVASTDSVPYDPNNNKANALRRYLNQIRRELNL